MFGLYVLYGEVGMPIPRPSLNLLLDIDFAEVYVSRYFSTFALTMPAYRCTGTHRFVLPVCPPILSSFTQFWSFIGPYYVPGKHQVDSPPSSPLVPVLPLDLVRSDSDQDDEDTVDKNTSIDSEKVSDIEEVHDICDHSSLASDDDNSLPDKNTGDQDLLSNEQKKPVGRWTYSKGAAKKSAKKYPSCGTAKSENEISKEELHRESQRLIREAEVQLPRHTPKQFTRFSEFRQLIHSDSVGVSGNPGSTSDPCDSIAPGIHDVSSSEPLTLDTNLFDLEETSSRIVNEDRSTSYRTECLSCEIPNSTTGVPSNTEGFPTPTLIPMHSGIVKLPDSGDGFVDLSESPSASGDSLTAAGRLMARLQRHTNSSSRVHSDSRPTVSYTDYKVLTKVVDQGSGAEQLSLETVSHRSSQSGVDLTKLPSSQVRQYWKQHRRQLEEEMRIRRLELYETRLRETGGFNRLNNNALAANQNTEDDEDPEWHEEDEKADDSESSDSSTSSDGDDGGDETSSSSALEEDDDTDSVLHNRKVSRHRRISAFVDDEAEEDSGEEDGEMESADDDDELIRSTSGPTLFRNRANQSNISKFETFLDIEDFTDLPVKAKTILTNDVSSTTIATTAKKDNYQMVEASRLAAGASLGPGDVDLFLSDYSSIMDRSVNPASILASTRLDATTLQEPRRNSATMDNDESGISQWNNTPYELLYSQKPISQQSLLKEVSISSENTSLDNWSKPPINTEVSRPQQISSQDTLILSQASVSTVPEASVNAASDTVVLALENSSVYDSQNGHSMCRKMFAQTKSCPLTTEEKCSKDNHFQVDLYQQDSQKQSSYPNDSTQQDQDVGPIYGSTTQSQDSQLKHDKRIQFLDQFDSQPPLGLNSQSLDQNLQPTGYEDPLTDASLNPVSGVPPSTDSQSQDAYHRRCQLFATQTELSSNSTSNHQWSLGSPSSIDKNCLAASTSQDSSYPMSSLENKTPFDSQPPCTFKGNEDCELTGVSLFSFQGQPYSQDSGPPSDVAKDDFHQSASEKGSSPLFHNKKEVSTTGNLVKSFPSSPSEKFSKSETKPIKRQRIILLEDVVDEIGFATGSKPDTKHLVCGGLRTALVKPNEEVARTVASTIPTAGYKEEDTEGYNKTLGHEGGSDIGVEGESMEDTDDESEVEELSEDGDGDLVTSDDEEEALRAAIVHGDSAKTSKKFRLTDFVEDEAELSGDEQERAFYGDEDEDLDDEQDIDLDALEIDDDDPTIPSAGRLRRQVERVHMRLQADQDQREIRYLKELYLEDGDLYTEDGRQRERRFRWRGLENEDPLIETHISSELDRDSDEGDADEHDSTFKVTRFGPIDKWLRDGNSNHRDLTKTTESDNIQFSASEEGNDQDKSSSEDEGTESMDTGSQANSITSVLLLGRKAILRSRNVRHPKIIVQKFSNRPPPVSSAATKGSSSKTVQFSKTQSLDNYFSSLEPSDSIDSTASSDADMKSETARAESHVFAVPSVDGIVRPKTTKRGSLLNRISYRFAEVGGDCMSLRPGSISHNALHRSSDEQTSSLSVSGESSNHPSTSNFLQLHSKIGLSCFNVRGNPDASGQFKRTSSLRHAAISQSDPLLVPDTDTQSETTRQQKPTIQPIRKPEGLKRSVPVVGKPGLPEIKRQRSISVFQALT